MNRFFSLVRTYKLFFSILVPLLLLTSVSTARRHQDSKTVLGRGSSRDKVVIQPQPNAPLAITRASVDSTDPFTPSIAITLTNAGNELIRAFTLRCETHFGESRMISWSLNNIRSIENCFRPQDTRIITINDTNYSRPPESAVLSIDFVEFLDGSRWGEDTYRSGERLDGWRAGAHAEVESILNKIETRGLNVAIKSIESNGSDTALPSGASLEYLDGFRLGVDAVRARALHSERKNNDKGLVNELRRPIDLSDWR